MGPLQRNQRVVGMERLDILRLGLEVDPRDLREQEIRTEHPLDDRQDIRVDRDAPVQRIGLQDARRSVERTVLLGLIRLEILESLLLDLSDPVEDAQPEVLIDRVVENGKPVDLHVV